MLFFNKEKIEMSSKNTASNGTSMFVWLLLIILLLFKADRDDTSRVQSNVIALQQRVSQLESIIKELTKEEVKEGTETQ